MNTIADAVKSIDDSLLEADIRFKKIPTKITIGDTFLFGNLFTLTDILADINCLAKGERLFSIPTLTRSLLESYIDLLLITKDRDNVYILIDDSYRKSVKAFKAFLSDRVNVQLEQSVWDDLELQLINWQKKAEFFAGLNKKGRMTIKEKFITVDHRWEYENIYSDLCKHTHNDIGLLEERHFNLESQYDIQMRYMQNYKFADYHRCFSTAVEVYTKAIDAVNAELKLGWEELTPKFELTRQNAIDSIN